MEKTSRSRALITSLVQRILRHEEPAPIAGIHERLAEAFEQQPALNDLLQGKKYLGTPLHPALVHFPIGATCSAALLDLFGRSRARRATNAVQAFGLAIAAPAALTGLADFLAARHDPKVASLGSVHAGAAGLGSILSAASIGARLGRQDRLARTLLHASCTAYLVAGMLGGELVHGSVGSDRD